MHPLVCYYKLILSLVLVNLYTQAVLAQPRPLDPHYQTVKTTKFQKQGYEQAWAKPVVISGIEPGDENWRLVGKVQDDVLRLQEVKTGAFYRLSWLPNQVYTHPFGRVMAQVLANKVQLPFAKVAVYRWWGKPALLQAELPDGISCISTDSLISQLKNKALQGGYDQGLYASFRLLSIFLAAPQHLPKTWQAFGAGDLTVYAPVWEGHAGFFAQYDGFVHRVSARLDSDLYRPQFLNPKLPKFSPDFVQPEDLALLSELKAADWQDTAHYLQGRLSDAVFLEALRQIPEPVLQVDAARLMKAFQARRAQLPQMAANFFAQLQRHQQGVAKADRLQLLGSVALNVTDRILAGPSFIWTKAGVEAPYRTRQTLSTGVGLLATGAFNLNYTGSWWKLLGKLNLRIEASLLRPTNVHTFYPLGNETTNSSASHDFYLLKRFRQRAAVYLERATPDFNQFVRAGGYLESVQIEGQNMAPMELGTLANAYQDRVVVGLHSMARIRRRDPQKILASGWELNAQAKYGKSFPDEGQKGFLNLQASGVIAYLLPTFRPHLLTLRLGGAHLIGTFPFYEANRLGQLTNLRGYWQRRFGGRSMAFTNFEYRNEVITKAMFLGGGSAGLLVFGDLGRVWQDGESSKRWHRSSGVGVWAKLKNQWLFSSWLAFSPEYKWGLPMSQIGFFF